jgi:hypothetical protein
MKKEKSNQLTKQSLKKLRFKTKFTGWMIGGRVGGCKGHHIFFLTKIA